MTGPVFVDTTRFGWSIRLRCRTERRKRYWKPWHRERLIVVEALIFDLPLMSVETLFDRYGVNHIW